MHRKFLPFILFVFLGFSNCKKKTSASPDILLAKTWKKASIDKNTATNPAGAVIYYPVQNCEMDDVLNFGSDGNLLIKKGSVKCDQNETQNDIQTYSINRTTKEFIINGTTYVLAEESSNQIKYYTAISTGTGFQNLIFLLQ